MVHLNRSVADVNTQHARADPLVGVRLRMRPPPIGNHAIADILRETERLGSARPAVGTPAAAPRSIARGIVGAGARVSRGLIPRDAVLNDRLPDLRVR
jgi:hypothetical protein